MEEAYMEDTGRRGFLALIAAGSAAAVDFLYPGLAGGAVSGKAARGSAHGHAAVSNDGGRNVIEMTGSDPGFAGGVVAAATAHGLILRSDASVRTVRLPPGTVVWKEYDVTPEAIQLGDWVDVRGTPLPDGSLKARSGWIWVNIGRADGRVMSVSSDGVSVRSDGGRQVTMEFSPRLEVIHVGSGTAVTGGVKALQPGVTVGAVGLRLPGGRLRATRIWL
jgi:hypothetical protein